MRLITTDTLGAASIVLLGLMLSDCASELQCAPYARSMIGLPLTGPAPGWWDQSEGCLIHADRLVPGAVLVLHSDQSPFGRARVRRARGAKAMPDRRRAGKLGARPFRPCLAGA